MNDAKKYLPTFNKLFENINLAAGTGLFDKNLEQDVKKYVEIVISLCNILALHKQNVAEISNSAQVSIKQLVAGLQNNNKHEIDTSINSLAAAHKEIFERINGL